MPKPTPEQMANEAKSLTFGGLEFPPSGGRDNDRRLLD